MNTDNTRCNGVVKGISILNSLLKQLLLKPLGKFNDIILELRISTMLYLHDTVKHFLIYLGKFSIEK